jgi:hypothetical protein
MHTDWGRCGKYIAEFLLEHIKNFQHSNKKRTYKSSNRGTKESRRDRKGRWPGQCMWEGNTNLIPSQEMLFPGTHGRKCRV